MLVHNGRDVRTAPLVERQAALAALLEAPRLSVMRVTGFVGQGVWLFEQAKALELEGIVAKRLASPYAGGRSLDWLKIKRPGAVPPERFKRS
ncbi:hypothetical protein [Aquabacterium sp. J223]|uniref:ATP-dependent DNA ligase n=1 Tax=Aquabacterium sp. J223 TaxID=2898431 RepID=UPI0021AE119A|nr:hypothetical protein [Aquabacterium sp. J223]